MKCVFLFAVIMLCGINYSYSQDVIDIAVRGISDSKRNGAQKDRLEAIMDAKRQACEKSGLKLKSFTKVKNFKTEYDYVESQAETILLPGFQIIDNGYGADGTYSVVLVGKVKSTLGEAISSKEIKYAKSLKERGKKEEAKKYLEKYIDSETEEISSEAFYYYLLWGFSIDFSEDLEKFKIFYPKSPYLAKLNSISSNRLIIDKSYTFSINKPTESWHGYYKEHKIRLDPIYFNDNYEKEHKLNIYFRVSHNGISASPRDFYFSDFEIYHDNVLQVEFSGIESQRFVSGKNTFIFKADKYKKKLDIGDGFAMADLSITIHYTIDRKDNSKIENCTVYMKVIQESF